MNELSPGRIEFQELASAAIAYASLAGCASSSLTAIEVYEHLVNTVPAVATTLAEQLSTHADVGNRIRGVGVLSWARDIDDETRSRLWTQLSQDPSPMVRWHVQEALREQDRLPGE